MSPEKVKEQLIKVYTAPEIKKKVYEYVADHDGTTVSQFTEDALREALRVVNMLPAKTR